YLVEREQAGEADRLKGFAIAVDVFGKDADFDSATDAVVRVQAGRLRDLLQQYSETEGAGDAFRITVPRGSYVPVYEPRADRSCPPPADSPDVLTAPLPLPAGAAAAQASPLLMRQIQFIWLAIALVIGMLGVLLVRQGSFLSDTTAASEAEASEATASIKAASAMEALPTVYLAVKAGGTEADRVAAALRAGLTSFETIRFIGRDVSADRDRSADTTSFVYELLPGPEAGGVTIELQNVATDRVLLSRKLSRADAAPAVVEDRIADLLSTTAPASGTIYTAIEESGAQAGLVRCLLLNEDYYLDQNEETHEAAYRCLQALADQNAKSSLVYAELASLHVETVTDRYLYPPNATLEQAMVLAHKAVQNGATSPDAHRIYGYVNARLGKTDESIRWMRKAYELNTYDLSMAASYGYALIFAGRYREGTPIVSRAVDASSSHPSWWDFGLFVGAFMQGDMRRAGDAAEALTSASTKSHYLAARLIVADAAGDDKAKRTIMAELTKDYPKFVANPRRTFNQLIYPADLPDRLVDALRSAGLGGAS
ncbi:MAG: tetratricopeptide repeat protein, partial [Mesorhizobium sp.]